MKHPRQHTEENSAIGVGSSTVTHCAELFINDGVWLEMENSIRSPIITQNLYKKSRVSLNVTIDDLEQGYGTIKIIISLGRFEHPIPEEKVKVMFPENFTKKQV